MFRIVFENNSKNTSFILRHSRSVLLLVLVGLLSISHAMAGSVFDNIEWKLKRDKRDIQVYTGKIAGSTHRAVFSTATLDATPNEVVALLLDLKNCRDWASLCKEARVESQLSATESIVYGMKDLPFPARDRDSYSSVRWHFDDQSGIVSMDSQAVNGNYEKRKGVVRLDYAHVNWRIVPNDSGGVIVENYAHIDPNGNLPSWLTNMIAVEAPYKALRKMRSVLKTGKYKGQTIAFIPNTN